MISVTADGSFQHITYSQSVSDLAQIAFGICPILHHRGPADNLELRNFGEIVENLVLHSVGKVSIIFVRADVVEGKDRNAFFGWRRRWSSLVRGSQAPVTQEPRRQKNGKRHTCSQQHCTGQTRATP